jgi:hypothetical protein
VKGSVLMKIIHKVLAIIPTFCFFSFPVLSMENPEDKENKYTCIFDKGGPVLDPENPYKVQHTALSDGFCERRGKLPYQFPEEGSHVLALGDYRVDKAKRLGYGDEGDVF